VLGVNPALGRPEHHEFRWVDLAEAYALAAPRLQAVISWAASKLLLAAQLAVYALTSVVALVLLVVTGFVAFAIPLPGNPIGYGVAFVLGMTSLFAIGLLVAAVAPTNRAATAIAIPMFFAVMFLGGVYLPRTLLPEVFQRIGDFTPPGVQGLQDAWLGATPQVLPLVGMALVTVALGAIAVRVFRWE